MDMFSFTTLLTTTTFLLHIGLLVYLLLYFVTKKVTIPSLDGFMRSVNSNLRKYGLLYSGAVALIATVSPLIYTYVYHLTPCTLCWYQRIFMFPLAVILLIAHVRKDYFIRLYGYVLAILGLCISVYHYVTQQIWSITGVYTGGCDVVGMSSSPSCSEYFFMEFGYITIPMMAMTGFVLVIFFLWRTQATHTT